VALALWYDYHDARTVVRMCSGVILICQILWGMAPIDVRDSSM